MNNFSALFKIFLIWSFILLFIFVIVKLITIINSSIKKTIKNTNNFLIKSILQAFLSFVTLTALFFVFASYVTLLDQYLGIFDRIIGSLKIALIPSFFISFIFLFVFLVVNYKKSLSE